MGKAPAMGKAPVRVQTHRRRQKGRILRREVGLSAVSLRLKDNPSLRTPGISYAPWDFSGRSAPYHGPEMNVASIWDDGTIDHRRWKFLSSLACEFFDRSPVGCVYGQGAQHRRALIFRQSVRDRRPCRIGRRRLSVGTAISRTAVLQRRRGTLSRPCRIRLTR